MAQKVSDCKRRFFRIRFAIIPKEVYSGVSRKARRLPQRSKTANKYRLGQTVLVDGLPHSIVAITRNKNGIKNATVQSWAGVRTVISAAKLRAGWIG